MRVEFLQRGLWLLKEDETENLIPDEDLVNLTGKDSAEVKTLKVIRTNLSETFEKELFGNTKPEIAFDIVSYYKKKGNSPFDNLIKWIVE